MGIPLSPLTVQVRALAGPQACRNNKSQMWLTMASRLRLLRSLTLMLASDIEAGGCRLPLRAASGAWNFLLAPATRWMSCRGDHAQRPVEKVVAMAAPEGLVAGRVGQQRGHARRERGGWSDWARPLACRRRGRRELPERAAASWSGGSCS